MHGRNRAFVFLLILLSFFVSFNFHATRASAATGINSQISFQGKLVKSDNTNITDGTYNMEFKVYQNGTNTGVGSTLLWTEDYLVAGSTGMPSTGGVALSSGTFSVNLASICAFSGGTCGAKTNTAVDFNQDTLWVSVQIGNTTSCTVTSSTTSFNTACGGDGEMSPYIRLTAVPYALNANLLNGLSSTALGQLATNQTWTGTNTFQPATNINGVTIRQTSVGSPTADIFNVQTANSTNVLQVTGPSANNAAVILNAIGTGTLTLGNAGTANDIQIGNTTGAVTQNINIGNNATASSVTNLVLGNLLSTSTTTIQSGSGNTILVNNTANKGVIIKNTAGSNATFQIQDNGGTVMTNYDASGINTSNIVTNESFEAGSTTGWIGALNGTAGTCALSSVTAATASPVQVTPYVSSYMAQCINPATAGAEFKYITGALTPSTAYTLDFYAVSSANGAANATNYLNFGHVENAGGEDVAGLSLTSQNVLTNGWTHYSLSFKTGATLTANDYVYIKQNDATARSLWLDGVTLQTDTNADTVYREGKMQLFGSVTSSLILQNATNSSGAFQINNAGGAPVLTVSTLDTNLMPNPGAEVNTTGWSAKATGTIARDTSQAQFGFASFKVTATSTSGDGAQYTGLSLPTGQTYSIAFSVKNSGSAFGAGGLVAGITNTGGDTNCTLAPAVSATVPTTTGWTRFTCTVAITTTVGTAFYIKTNEAVAHTFWVDGIELDSGTTLSPYGVGSLAINAVVTTPLTVQNQVILASSTATGNGSVQFQNTTNTNTATIAAGVTTASYTWTLPTADAAGCLQSNGTGTLSISACGDTHIDTIATTATWTKPTNALIVIVEGWGAGGGGGGGAGNTTAAARTGGGGGGGGSYAISQFTGSSLGATVPVTIGTGGTLGTGGATAVGGNGGVGGNTCFSTTTACAGTIYMLSGGGGGGSGAGAAGNGGGGGGGDGSAGAAATGTATGGVGGGNLGTANTVNSGFGGAGGGTAGAGTVNGLSAEYGGGGGAPSVTAGAANSGAGGSSVMGAGGGGGGGSCAITTCTLRTGGAGGLAGSLTAGGGGTAGTTAGQAGGAGPAGCTGVLFGGDGGGGGANNAAGTGGAGGVGGAGGGGGGGGGAGETTTGGAGGAGGAGCMRITTLRGTGADLAEIYCTNDVSVQSGDIVSIDGSLRSGVKKSASAYDSTAVGIISTNPGLVTGSVEDQCAKPVLVALAGRVPTKVSLENGPIQPGDYLTPSSTPGVAMRATKAGQIIGQSLTAYSDSSLPNYVVAFVEHGTFNGTSLAQALPAPTDTTQPIEQQALAYFMSLPEKATATTPTNLSEILADRVSASLEIITPTVISDKVVTNTITPSSTGNVTISLGENNNVFVKNQAGGNSFSIDSTGNAQFDLSLSVLGDMQAKGNLTVSGDSLFSGNATFAKMAQFLGDTSFTGDVNVTGKVTFNSDSGGVAIIKQGDSRVDVLFDKAYAQNPIISASLAADQVQLPDGTNENIRLKEQRLFNAGYSYLISNVSNKGFTIVLNKNASENIQFNWTSISVKDAKTSTSVTDTTTNPITP